MYLKTIAKFTLIVISMLLCLIALLSCSNNSRSATKSSESGEFGAPQIIGTISSDEITESSGLAVSRCNPGIFWTHNDSRQKPEIFALNSKGNLVATYTVAGAKNVDWEDMSARKIGNQCFLYIGDFGNNTNTRSEFTIYKFVEPEIGDTRSPNNLETGHATSINFSYPDIRQNAEAMMINAQTGDIYVSSKNFSGAASIYKLPSGEKSGVATKLGDIDLPSIPNGLITAGDISDDGRHVAFCDYYNAYEYTLPESEKNFDAIFKQVPAVINLGKREQGETIAYSKDGNSIFATSEGENSPLIRVDRR